MNQEELFAGLFPVPYNYEKWLQDQLILIERFKNAPDKYFLEQAIILEKFQKAKQCSSLMLDLMVDRIKRHENST